MGSFIYFIYVLVAFAILLVFMGVRIVRPNEKGVVETLGKYSKTLDSGMARLTWVLFMPYKRNLPESYSLV